MIVALFAIPPLIEGIGKERFGLLTIIWLGVGYFSLFDMGLGRALTKLVAERVKSEKKEESRSLIWTAISIIFVLGLAGALFVWLAAPSATRRFFHAGPDFESEAILALRILASGLPIVVLTTAFIGILEARQKFASITAVRVPMGALTYALPLAVIQFTPSLAWVTATLVFARAIALAAYFAVAASVEPDLRRKIRIDRAFVRPLFRFGGWLTVTNIVGPLLVYLDRFLIGAIISLTAVAYYATPYEALSRLQIISRSLMGVLFPAFATALSADRQRLTVVYAQATRALVHLMLPITSALFLFAGEGLELWLGKEFRVFSTPVVEWLAVGLFVNALARMPFTLLQSAGRPELVAKTHLAELAPYVAILWLFAHRYGIVGAAAAWTMRVTADCLVLNSLAMREVPEISNILKRTTLVIALILVGFCGASFAKSLGVRIVLLTMVAAFSTASLAPMVSKLLQSGARKTI